MREHILRRIDLPEVAAGATGVAEPAECEDV